MTLRDTRITTTGLLLFCVILLAGCSKPPHMAAKQRAEYDAVFASAKWTPAVQVKWARSCALCHVAGQGGAPRIGHPADWAPRLRQGKAVLLMHTLDGYRQMPPLGYCMDCDMTDFAAMIDMMSRQRK